MSSAALFDLDDRRSLGRFHDCRRAGHNAWHWREKDACHARPPWDVDGSLIYGVGGGVSRVRWLGWSGERPIYSQECGAPMSLGVASNWSKLAFGVAALVAGAMGLPLPPLCIGATDYYSGTNDNAIRCDNAVYATAHDAASGTLSLIYATSDTVGQTNNAGGLYRIWRLFEPVDASGLPDTCNLVSGTHSFFLAYSGAATDFDVTLVGFTGSNPCVAGDYDLFGATSFGSVTTVGMSYVAYTVITLNAAGLAAISKTAVTLLGLRSSRDISATTPTTDEYISIYMADQEGTDKDPKLTLTYVVTVTSDQTLKWNIGTSGIVSTQTLKWNIGGTVVGTQTLKWNIGGHVHFYPRPSAWDQDLGPRVTRIRVRKDGGTTYFTASTGGVTNHNEVVIVAPATTTDGEAQAMADAALAAYAARPIHVSGPILSNALLSFGELVDAAAYRTEHAGDTVAYVERASASGLQITRIIHTSADNRTIVELGDAVPDIDQLLAETATKTD